MHPEKVAGWCAIYARGIIVPYSSETAQEKRITVKGVCYRAMLNDNFFLIVIENYLDQFWFNKTSVTCHTNEIMALLQKPFGEIFILRNDKVIQHDLVIQQ